MIIKNEKPPIYNEAHAHFEIDDSETIYTWGDTIYNPGRINVVPELIEHESVHMQQQEEIGGPEIWWRNYFENPAFRLQQEVEAYGRQHNYFCTKVKDRNRQAKHLWTLAQALSSPLYKLELGHIEAQKLIRQAS